MDEFSRFDQVISNITTFFHKIGFFSTHFRSYTLCFHLSKCCSTLTYRKVLETLKLEKFSDFFFTFQIWLHYYKKNWHYIAKGSCRLQGFFWFFFAFSHQWTRVSSSLKVKMARYDWTEEGTEFCFFEVIKEKNTTTKTTTRHAAFSGEFH